MAAMTKLTSKQEAYCQEYIVDLNQVAAAKRAKYSPASAKISAGKNMQNPLVLARIAELQRGSIERTRVNADWLLTRLADEADADIADLYNENGNLKPVNEWPTIWRKGLVSGFDIERPRGLAGESVEIVKIRLSDRVKRLELIGRHIAVGAFTDDGEREPAAINITINRPGPAENGD